MAIPNTYDLAQYAQLAYDEHTLSFNDLETLILERDDHIVVAVRGTEISVDTSIPDIVRDLMFMPHYDRDNGFAHAGMSTGAHFLARELQKYIGLSDKPFYLTGHSLGAFVSLLLVNELRGRGYKVLHWVGLGTPNGFWGPLTTSFDGVELQAFRFGRDIVTYVPLFTMGYHLPCPQIKIGQSLRGWPTRHDHSIELYLDAMMRLSINRSLHIKRVS